MAAPAMRRSTKAVYESRTVDKTTPCRVHQIGRWLHQTKLAIAHDASGPIAQHDVQRHDVGTTKEIVFLDVRRARKCGALGAEILTPCDRDHAEDLGDLGDLFSDATQADDADGLPRDDLTETGLPTTRADVSIAGRDLL